MHCRRKNAPFAISFLSFAKFRHLCLLAMWATQNFIVDYKNEAIQLFS